MRFRLLSRGMLNGWHLVRWKGLEKVDLGEKEIERVKYPLRKPEPAIPVPNWPVKMPVEAPAIPVEIPAGVPTK